MADNLPIFTDYVDQNYFIEALGGPTNQQNYLDAFPDSIYSKAWDSSLVRLLYALIGPSGAGYLRRQYLEARLQLESQYFTGDNLDALYSNPFGFLRLAEETYTIDGSASILPAYERGQILSFDASFRNRAMLWLSAIQAGGTPLGISLAAESGMNHPVTVIENYKALYDQYMDAPLGLPYLGSTDSLSEFILIPRQDVPSSAQQSFFFVSSSSGYFSITIPMGPPYIVVPGIITASSPGNVLQVPDASLFPPGVMVALATQFDYFGTHTSIKWVQVDANVSTMTQQQVTVVYPPDDTHAPFTAYPLTGSQSYIGLVANAQTTSLPYNATWDQIQYALGALPILESTANVVVTGGPLPTNPITISFIGALANLDIPEMVINVGDDVFTGVGYNTWTPSAISLSNVEQSYNIVNQEFDATLQQFAPGDLRAAQYAVDLLRPVTSFFTETAGQGVTQRQPFNSIFAGQQFTEVLRYTTGSGNVDWPDTTGDNWIEAGLEHEAPSANDMNGHYINFHSIVNVVSYTELAFADANYQTDFNPNPYLDIKVGPYSAIQQVLYPFLGQYRNPYLQFNPIDALYTQPDQPYISAITDTSGVINNSYPTNYVGLSGITQQPIPPSAFWASAERPLGGDFIEIDLGTPQAVNYIYFEATNKPYDIVVAYDCLDQAPARRFLPAGIVPSYAGPAITSLQFQNSTTNAWTPVTWQVVNTLGQMIYTRFIRIGFLRRPSGPFANNVPFSIEMRNLRIGRNTNSSLANNTELLSPAAYASGAGTNGPAAAFSWTKEGFDGEPLSPPISSFTYTHA